jgi:tRNA threonylcarbamoyladenosine biosynthesis protein TsaB
VALVDQDQVVSVRLHQELNRHGERMLPLVEELLSEAGWALNSLDRIGVGVGPGSFTGLRIGVALAQGIALGLDRPVVGVGSLQAMAFASPPSDGPTIAVLDARHDEYFVALYSSTGTELVSPRTIPQAGAEQTLLELAGGPVRVVGLPAASWSNGFTSDLTDLPSATATARLALRLDPAAHPALPAYVRGANAIKPNLPPSPLRPV